MTDHIATAIDAFRRIWPGPEIQHAAARELLAALEAAGHEVRAIQSAREAEHREWSRTIEEKSAVISDRDRLLAELARLANALTMAEWERDQARGAFASMSENHRSAIVDRDRLAAEVEALEGRKVCLRGIPTLHTGDGPYLRGCTVYERIRGAGIVVDAKP